MASQCPHPAKPMVLPFQKKMETTIRERRAASRALKLTGKSTMEAQAAQAVPATPATPTIPTKSNKTSDGLHSKPNSPRFDKFSDVKDTAEEATIFYTKNDARTQKRVCLVPPKEFREIPKFNEMGPKNCGHHEWNVDPDKHIVEDGVIKVCCQDCHTLHAIHDVHMLPCKHMLCHDCLCWAVQNMVDQLCDMECFEELMTFKTVCHDTRMDLNYYKEDEKKMGEKEKKMYRKRRQDMKNSHNRAVTVVRELMGNICCGKAMNLWSVAECLPPTLAESLWLVDELERAHPMYMNLRCGWPDCRQFIPVSSSFKFEDDTEELFFCMNCGGCSMWGGSNGRRVWLNPTYIRRSDTQNVSVNFKGSPAEKLLVDFEEKQEKKKNGGKSK